MTTTTQPPATKRKQEQDGEPVLPPSPFTTTTDVMNRLNDIMERYYTPGTTLLDEEEQDDNSDHENDDDDDTSDEDGRATARATVPAATPAFALQRKLPDGTTRPATEAELQAADLETKIKQVAEHVAKLPNDAAKLAFCDQHRRYGNQLYAQRHYAQAMDVYLTCLTAIPTTAITNNTSDENNNNNNNDDATAIEPGGGSSTTNRGQYLVFYQLLNNLAQTALQLHWYRKAQEFCRLALEEVYQQNNNNNNTTTSGHDGDDSLSLLSSSSPMFTWQIVKLYFKRAKASRLRGEYGAARKDLTAAHSLLTILEEQQPTPNDDDTHKKDDDKQQETTTTTATTIASSRLALQKELQAVQRAQQKGRKNQSREKKAMQLVFWGASSSGTTKGSLQQNENKNGNAAKIVENFEPLYQSPKGRERRAYSTLRAPKSSPEANYDDDDDSVEIPGTLTMYWYYYYYYYLRLVGRVAETLLQWIGEDEDATEEGRVKAD
eukprot:scaffold5860_cov223-Amphora_coffeaeformis.AAC.8